VTALTQPWHDVVFAGQGSVFKVFDRSSTEVIYADAIFVDQAIHGLAHQSINSDTLLLLAWGGRSICFCHVSREQSNKSKTGYNLYVDHKSVVKISDWIFDIAFRPAVGGRLASSWEAVAVTAHNELLELRSRREQIGYDKNTSTIVTEKLFSGPKCGLYSATLQWLSLNLLLVVSGTAFGEIVVWSMKLEDTVVDARRHHVFTGHEGSIFGVRVSDEISVADGANMRLLASCSDDRTIRIWNISDLQNGTVLSKKGAIDNERESSRTTGFLNYVSEEAAAESSKLCVATGMGHLSRIWDIRFAIERGLRKDDGYICSVVSVGEDATCQTWHLKHNFAAGNQACQLMQVASNNLHDGKNLWSMSVAHESTQSCILTGGADGKIVEHSSLEQHTESKDDHLTMSEWTIDDALKHVLLAEAKDEQRSESSAGHVAANSSRKKDKQDSFRSFAAIGISQLLITTNEGLVLLATNVSTGQWTWKRLAQFDDLKGYSVACHLVAEPFEYVFFGDARGTIYYYHSFFETIKVLSKIEGKITKLMAEILPSRTHEYMSIVVTRQGGYPPVQLRINLGFGGSISLASTKTFSKWSPDFPQITSAVVATHDSVEKGLIIGCRNGTIYSYSNVEAPGKREFDFELPLSHGKEAVTAMSWLAHRGHQNNIWSPSFGWLFSVGRDGTLVIHNWEGNYTDPVLVHRLSLSFGPNLEGISIDPITLDVCVWGFTSKYFILQNVSALENVVSVECGGAHRVWNFAPFEVLWDGMSRGLFAWIKAMRLNLASVNGSSHKVLQSGSHGREIKTCAVAPAIIHRGLGPLVATGAEDTDITISYFADWHVGQAQLKRLVVLQKHVTGVQSLHWSSDGNFLFSCGGFEEFFVWHLRSIPGISIGVVCESKLPHETLDAELRITDFSVCDVATRERSSLGDEHWVFLISMVYSDSSIRVC
jgi:WD40 repeat protein